VIKIQEINFSRLTAANDGDATDVGFLFEIMVHVGSETSGPEGVAIYAIFPSSCLIRGVTGQSTIFYFVMQASSMTQLQIKTAESRIPSLFEATESVRPEQFGIRQVNWDPRDQTL